MTLAQMIRDRHRRWKDRACLRERGPDGYRDISWDSFYNTSQDLAGALVAHGIGARDRVAILSHTRAEWAMADTAILSAGAVCVPLYPTLTRPELTPLLRRCGARGLFLADTEQLARCLPLLDEVEPLEFLVVFDDTAGAACTDPRVSGLATFRADGGEYRPTVEERLESAQDTDLATIIFTSGTTGEPKGVMLSHTNILSNVEAALQLFDIGPDDVCLAHLPLAHIFERMAGYYLMLSAGAVIAYAEDLQSVARNLTEVHPTVAISVPRIFEKTYAGIQANTATATGPAKALAFWALGVARRAGDLLAAGHTLPASLRLQHRIADRLVYSKIRAKMGGRLRYFLAGGAPLAPELAKFFTAVGIPVFEGYGLTETSPVIAANFPGHNRAGSVGLPLGNVDVKIAEDGEILVRGPSVFTGYFENPAATAEAFTDEGFFQTGDIGELDADGFLLITDRKKDLIVTAGGKNVAPQKVENILKLSKYIAEVMLYGDQKKFLSALIVPDFEWLRRYAKHKGLPSDDGAALVVHPQVQDFYQRLVTELQSKAGLPSHESVKRFVLLDHGFTAGAGEVTPTLKLRRRSVTEHYQAQLEALYEPE